MSDDRGFVTGAPEAMATQLPDVRDKLRRVAKYQRAVIFAVLVNLILNLVFGRSGEVSAVVLLIAISLWLMICGISAVLVALLAHELYDIGRAIVCGVLVHREPVGDKVPDDAWHQGWFLGCQSEPNPVTPASANATRGCRHQSVGLCASAESAGLPVAAAAIWTHTPVTRLSASSRRQGSDTFSRPEHCHSVPAFATTTKRMRSPWRDSACFSC